MLQVDATPEEEEEEEDENLKMIRAPDWGQIGPIKDPHQPVLPHKPDKALKQTILRCDFRSLPPLLPGCVTHFRHEPLAARARSILAIVSASTPWSTPRTRAACLPRPLAFRRDTASFLGPTTDLQLTT